MRILVFYPYLPYPLNSGTNQRTFNLLKELCAEHQVDLLALAENNEGLEHQAVFEQFCRKIWVHPFVHPAWPKLFPTRLLNPLPSNIAHWTDPGIARKLSEILQANSYDVVHVCDIVLAQYFILQNKTIPLVIDRSRVDLQFQLMEHKNLSLSLKQKLLRYEGYAKLWFYERKIIRRARLEIVCGPDDKTFIHKRLNANAPVQVIPNGVDIAFFYPDASPAQRSPQPAILFCGVMNYSPNVDALKWYFQQIHSAVAQRFPELRVYLVGKNPTPEVVAFAKLPNVLVTGSVPDVRDYYKQAWLQIVPLRIGGGTRLKILESLAMGTPVLSTRIGAQGLDLHHKEDVLFADTAQEFIETLSQALQDECLRTRVAAAGLKTAQTRFSWKKIGLQLNALYSRLLQR